MHVLPAVELCLLAFFSYSSYAQDTNSTLAISEDGNCGGTTGQTCLGSSFGNCCSGKGYCGATSDYCNAECQSSFGQCVVNASSISSDGRCGTTDPSIQLCLGSSFGSCCSETGWCGSSDVYCGTGCQGDFGECNGTSAVVVPTTSQTTSVSTSSSSLSSSTSSNPPEASGTLNVVAEPVTSSTMSTGAKAGVGVGAAAAAIAVIGGLLFLVRRRKARKQPSEVDEKVETRNTSLSRGPSSATVNHDAYINGKDLPPVPLPAEMGNKRDSRVELGADLHSHAFELDSKVGSSTATELPAYKE